MSLQTWNRFAQSALLIGLCLSSTLASAAVVLVPRNASWKYNNTGNNLGTTWKDPGFGDISWPSGNAELGSGDGGEATVIDLGPVGARYPTIYFRRTFQVTGAALYTNLTVSLLRDDGGVVYLNGTEVFRSNLPGGAIAYGTLASANVGGGAESTFFPTNVNPSLLLEGNNVLAVEIHQAVTNSTAGANDLSFDLELTGDVNNAPPDVLITSPANNDSFPGPADIPLQASASDSDGTVTLVEFFANGNKVGEDPTDPYQATWAGAPLGSHVLTAVATDNLGGKRTSPAVNISVTGIGPTTFIQLGATWKYLDDGSDQGTAWTAVGFLDESWPSGPAELGYGDGDEATPVGFGPDGNNKFITTYFRRSFTVPDPSIFTVLNLGVKRDDGVVVYLNGTEIYRSNMPGGPIAFNTLASSATGDDGTTLFTTTVNPALLNTGANTVAAEVHQNVGTSSDISFDLELSGSTDPIVNDPPTVSITSPANNAAFSAPATIPISVSASDTDGSVSLVEFFSDGSKIGEDVGSPFGFTWSGIPAGSYQLRAIATDNLGEKGTSTVVNVSVSIPSPPTILSVSPTPGGVSILSQITVTFSEAVRGVDAADLLINGVPAASMAGADDQYTFSFPQPREGTVRVAWRGGAGISDYENPPQSFDIYGAGASWQYTFADAQAPLVSAIDPAPGATLRQLTRIKVTFNEPVVGVNAGDLLVGGLAASSVTGSGSGPYEFSFAQPMPGAINAAWLTGHGIRDQSTDANSFAGGSWSYTLNTNAIFEGRVVINEIMYHPASDVEAEEYIELFNLGPDSVNLTGWRFTRGVDFTFPNVTLNAGAYLVVAANAAALQAKYPGLANVVGNWTGRLSNGGEDVELEDASGNRADLVEYADEGEWAVRRPWVSDPRGWEWYAEADGLGKSMELRNPNLRNNTGQNWQTSLAVNGSPGQVNAVASNNIAPLLLEVGHFPAVPRSTSPVTITASVVDELATGLGVTLFYRNASTTSPPNFSSATMLDNGMQNDGGPNDGVFGAILPPEPDGTVIEFYVQATDTAGNLRTFPAPSVTSGGQTNQNVNALYQVDDEVEDGVQPFNRVVMTETERARLAAGPRNDAEMNATLVSLERGATQIRYNCGLRYRGAGSRGLNPPTYRLNIPRDRKWNQKSGVNFNSQYVAGQVLGSMVSHLAGLPAEYTRPVQLRINSTNPAGSGAPQFGSYAEVEPTSDEWADNHYPDDGDGNVYRASTGAHSADLTYEGTNPNAYISAGYLKNSNDSENDWQDLINLTFTMDPLFTPDGDFVQSFHANANLELFLRYFATLSLMEYSETSLASGRGDDYGMYRGILDPRFTIIPHDFDTVFGQDGNANESIFVATALGTVNRFLHTPAFEQKYYAEFQRLLGSTFATNQLYPTIDRFLGGWVGLGSPTLNAMKTFINNRNTSVAAQIPGGFSPPPVATISGEPPAVTYVNSASLTVGGTGITHYRYRLNGGALGAETPVATPITLSSLANGTYTVFVIGRNSTGTYQAESEATLSDTWTVNSALRGLVFNEVLARNDTAVPHVGTFPDMIELFNAGASSVNLEGMSLTDDPDQPGKFIFPAGSSLAAGNYLTLLADDPNGTPGLHIGFSLAQEGETLYLFDKESAGGRLLDTIEFGFQLPDRSVGRLASGHWSLTMPTFGSANTALPTGNFATLKINEWLADGIVPFADDFIEIYNPDTLPVDLGGLYLTDKPAGSPRKHRITPLTFVTGRGFLSFLADNQPGQGANHVNFALSSQIGEIGLADRDGKIIDQVIYGAQYAGITEGRTPNGSNRIQFLAAPSPGAGNPAVVEPIPPVTVNLVPINDTFLWKYEQTGTDLGTEWKEIGYGDSGWPEGPALLAVEDPILPEPIRTPLSYTTPQQSTFHFRARFNVPPNVTFSGLQLTHIIDDGAVVYLNGTEVYRVNMPAGTPTYATLASGSVGNATYQGPFNIPLGALVPNENVIAVEVHQQSLSSSDVVLGLSLDGIVLTNTPSAAGIVINEVLANTGTNDTDWVELFNPSNAAVDLEDMSLTDNPANARRWIFPVGSVVPAQGYLRVLFDSGSLPSGTNTGFGLKATGDSVYLFDTLAGGGSQRDAVNFGIQASDWPMGRVPDASTNWVLCVPTPLGNNVAATLGDPGQLKINEWMASPASGSDWFELYNPNPQPVALGGLHLSDDPADPLLSRIPNRSFIGTGLRGFQEFKADEDLNAGADHVDFRLSAGGETVGLSDANGTWLERVTFLAQAANVSQGRLTDGTTNIVSFPQSPTPGDSNFLPLQHVVINEVLTHTDGALEDAIELRNLVTTNVNIGGWFLSDAKTRLQKYRIPDGTFLPASGYKVFYETQFNSVPGDPLSFSLSSARGDEVYLSAATAAGALTGLRANVEFDAAENGVSFGRYGTSVGVEFVPMSLRTFGVDNPDTVQQFRTGTGLPNSAPKVGPIVINEIMYHPPDLQTNDNTRDEFIELHNITGSSVSLFDPAANTNTWRLRDAVSFRFPTNLSIPANGYIVVVSFDPLTNPTDLAGFRTKYGLSTSVPIYGPYDGKLDNSNDSVELYKPDPPEPPGSPEPGFVPYIRVDRIKYADLPPWPTSPDGLGNSLQRLTSSSFGNDPVNWQGGAPTPGSANFSSANNTPPILNPIGGKTVIESNLLSFTATATDAESPPQSLTYSLDPGAPAGTTINSGNGTFNWRPIETQGPGNYTVTIRVTDNGTPNLSDAETISITVNEANLAPVLNGIGNRSVAEGNTLAFNASATDGDLPGQPLTYSLDAGAPTGTSINSTNGAFSWAPTEFQGPGVYTVTVRVTDSFIPAGTDSETIQITVNEVNSAPTITTVTPKTVNEGSPLTFSVLATDPDQPPQTLTYNLEPGAPAGATINATNGTFAWTPPVGHTPATNNITVRATDSGSPTLNDTETFQVVVVAAPVITAIAKTNDLVTITWSSSPGRTYRLQMKTNLTDLAWSNVGNTTNATTASTTVTDNVAGRSRRFYQVLRTN